MIRKLALLSLFPFALLCVAALRILARFGVLIRFGEVFTSRIGHHAGNLECYLCERDAGIQPKAIDIWVPQRCEPANTFLAKMTARAVRMGPGPLVRLVSLTNVLFDGWQKHIIDPVQYDRDIFNLYERFPPHFKFTMDEMTRGVTQLIKWGIPINTTPVEWVCLIVRDAAYLPERTYHSYRDSDVDTYELAALELAERGYYVFRMGAKVEKPFKATHPRIFDYATNGMHSHFMSVYLGAHCAFCISNGTGFDAIPQVFRRPICFVNYAPFEYLPTWTKPSLAIWKHHERDGKRMSIAEIVASEAGHFMAAQQYEGAGISLVNNTPEEIRDVVLEMADMVEGGCMPSAEQEAFWGRFPRSLSTFNNRPLHGEIRMRIGSKFLKQYAMESLGASGGVTSTGPMRVSHG